MHLYNKTINPNQSDELFELNQKRSLFLKQNEFMKNFDKEILEDEIFNIIKTDCFEYLDNKLLGKETSISEEELLGYSDFLKQKFDDMSNLKDSLNVEYYSNDFLDVSLTLSNYTISHNETELIDNLLTTDNLKFWLSKDITSLLDNITLVYGIVLMMLNDLDEKE